MGVTTHDTRTTYHPGLDVPVTTRIASLDIARGIIMILMAIDHVRVYAGVPAGGPTFGVFFTRWVTNFSAPGFAFLAGTGAFLYGLKINDKRALAKFLAVRGVLLILLELTVLRFAWTFNADFASYNLAGVIWMLGWCMILMSGLVFLPTRAVGIVGLALILGQPVFTPIGNLLPAVIGGPLYLGGQVHVGAFPLDILYVIVPWIGVMAAGYWFGEVVRNADSERRRRLCLRIGLTMTALFVAIGTALVLSKPAGENALPTFFRILNQRKYPASPLFLMMTLGPTIAFLPFAEGMTGRVGRFLSSFGRVPMFYYLLHIPLIHVSAIVVSYLRTGAVTPWLFENFPVEPGPVPPGYQWSLGLLYLDFVVVIALLYFPCRWFAGRKARDKTGLLRYL